MSTPNIVGYALRCQDNNSYMFSEDMAASIRREARVRLKEYGVGAVLDFPSITEADKQRNKCPFCGYRINFQPHNPNYKLGRKAIDLGTTYDGQTIVSSKFRKFCLTNKVEGITFKSFESSKSWFHLLATTEVAFDANRRETRFEYFCPTCKNYESVVGADPTYLLIGSPLPSGFFRTDLAFGSGNEKHPIFLVSLDIRSAIDESDLIGAEFSPAYGT